MPPLFPNELAPGVTPIDFSTILNDLDGTLTGVKVVAPNCGTVVRHRTSSVSVNHFFDAPAQMPECAAFGVQTSAYDFVTTVAAKLQPSGLASLRWVVDASTWTAPGAFPAVPIYRQLLLPEETPQCASVCSGTDWGCERGSFMAGTQNGQAPYLTTNNGAYYIDTNTQDLSCVTAGPQGTTKTPGWHTPGFTPGQTYLVWNLFAAPDTKVTYQIYVGPGFDPATDGHWVRVQPHVFHAVSGGANNLAVEDCTNCAGLPAVTVTNGVLAVTLDHGAVAGDFAFASRPDDEKCLPRDLCQIDGTNNTQCTVQDKAQFSGGSDKDFADLGGAVGEACQFWATATAGAATNPDTGEDVSLADCPAGGCLGYAFTLPGSFTPQPYQTVMTANPNLVAPFPSTDDWNVRLKLVDPTCRPTNPPDSLCPQLTGPPPTPLPVSGFKGKTKKVGRGTADATASLSGQFVIDGAIDLDRSTLTLGHLLDEVGGAGELARGAGGTNLLPLTLTAREGNRPDAVAFETPADVRPRVRVRLRQRDPELGLVEFSVKVDRATLPQGSGRCAGGPPLTTQLRTGFALDDGFNPPVFVATTQPWRCLGGQLRTP